jgi:hypothetical protein
MEKEYLILIWVEERGPGISGSFSNSILKNE